MITKTLNAHIEGQIGYTYEWVIASVSNCGDFIVEQVLGTGTMIAIEEDIELIIEHEDYCENLVIKLVIKDGNDECGLLMFDVINDNISLNSHWECIEDLESGSNCQQQAGLATLPEHYTTYNDCITCVDCNCNTNNPPDDPCDEFGFGAFYNCPTTPGGTGTLVIVLTSGPLSFSPVTLNTVLIQGPVNQLITNLGYSFDTIGESHAIQITLPAGTYNISPNLAFGEDCTISSVPVNINCLYGGGGTTLSGDIACCQGIDDAGLATSVGNIGLLNCYVLHYGNNIDADTQDLIFDFGANTVADKLEVYKGIVSCDDVFLDIVPSSLLVASTPYVGNISHCFNLETNFVPAVGSKIEDRNDVVNGVILVSGVYHSVNNPPTVIVNRNVFTNPTFASDMLGACATHSGTTNNYYPEAGCGGPNSGIARLVVPAGTYGNVDNKVTLVVHNNGTPSNLCPNDTNVTAWKLWAHCPECPECNIEFDVSGNCSVSGEGSISIYIVEEFEGPVTIKITPDNPNSLQYASITSLYLYLDSTNDYYELQLNAIDNYWYIDDLPTLPSGATIDLLYDSNFDLIDMNNDVWFIEIIDANDCNSIKYTTIDCSCSGSFLVSGETELCDTDELDITISLVNSPCSLSIDNLQYSVTPEASWINLTVEDDIINIINTSALVSGSYSILLEHTCDIGDCVISNYGNEIIIDISTFDCDIDIFVTRTTCGNSNGAITVDLCTGVTLAWNDIISGSRTRTNLAAGIYTATITQDLCEITVSAEIEDTSDLILSIDDYITPCKEVDAPSISLLVSGGTAPYDVDLYTLTGGSWGTPVFNDPNYISETSILYTSVTGGLDAGNYKFKVEDSAGCIKEIQFTVTDMAVPSIYFLSQQSYCEDDDGVILLLTSALVSGTHIVRLFNASGVTCDDFYSPLGIVVPWTEGSGGQYEINNLYAGTYSICASDIFTNCCDCKNVIVGNVGGMPDIPTVHNYYHCIGSVINLANPIYATCSSPGSIPKFYTPGSSTPLANTTITVNSNLTFEVRCLGGNCSSEMEELTIYALPNPVVTITGPNSVCRNAAFPLASLIAQCNGTGVWSFPNNAGQILTFAGICNGTTCAFPSSAWTVMSALTANVITVTFSCTASNGCIGISNKTINLVDTPLIQTQNLSFCPNQSITSGMLSGALLTSPLGYSCGTPTIYTNNDCSTLQNYPFNAPGAGLSVTKYLKVSCEPIDGGVSCATACIPFTITGTNNPTFPVTVTPSCTGSSFSAVFNAPSLGAGTYAWFVNLVLQGSTGNSLSLTGLTPGATLNVIATFTPNVGCTSSGGISYTVGQLPSIIMPSPTTTCVGDTIESSIVYFNNTNSISVSSTNTDVANVTIITTNGTVTITPTNTTVGTATITITAYTGVGNTGCFVTQTLLVTTTNCDPCSTCTYSYIGEQFDDSSFVFSDISVCGTQLERYIILVKDADGGNVAYISNITSGVAGVTLPAGTSSLNYLSTVVDPTIAVGGIITSITWSLPLIPGTYTLHLIYASNLPGICQQCVDVDIPECYGTIHITCADCNLIKEYSEFISGIVSSPAFQLCIPCNQQAVNIKLETYLTNPDSVIVANDSAFTNPVTLIPMSGYANEIGTIKLSTISSEPYTVDFSTGLNEVECNSEGYKIIYVKVRSGAIGVEGHARWKMTTSCCNPITNCPEFTIPCVKSYVVNMDDSFTYTIGANDPDEAMGMLLNICGNSCGSRCSTIPDIQITMPMSPYSFCGTDTFSIVNETKLITLANCGAATCYISNFNYDTCITNTSKLILDGTLKIDLINPTTIKFTFTNNDDYLDFKSEINDYLATSLSGCLGKSSGGLLFGGYYDNADPIAIITGCNDSGTIKSLGLTLKCCDEGICTDRYTSLDYNDSIRTIQITLDHTIESSPGTPVCDNCFSHNSFLQIPTGSSTGILGSNTQMIHRKDSITNNSLIRYGAAFEECNSFNTYTLRVVDTDDVDSWILYSEPRAICDTTYNSLHDGIDGSRRLLQFGDTFADAAAAITAVSGVVTLLDHTEGATNGVNNCIIF